MEHKIGDVFTMVEEDDLISTFILFHIKEFPSVEFGPTFYFIDGNASYFAQESGWESFSNLTDLTKIT